MIAAIAFAALALLMPISALAARRLPAQRVIALAAAWAGIFALGYALAAWMAR